MVAVAIRPPVDDLYRELGVGRDATRDEIAAAFRIRARELHPDARPADAPDAEERFKRLSRAYGVLGDPIQRARYDAGLEAPGLPAATPGRAAPAAPAGRPASPNRLHLTRRGARWMFWGGLGLVLLGVAAAVWVVALQRHDADLRARGVPAFATVVDVNGEHRLQFTTRDGRIVRAQEPTTGEQQPAVGTQVRIHYDRDDPTTVVTDTSHTGRDITLWIVAIKLLVGGAILMVFGARRLRRAA